MKQSEAIEHLRSLMVAVQKARSNVREELGLDLPKSGSPMDEALRKLVPDLNPLIYGDFSDQFLGALVQMLERAEAGYGVEPMAFYNMMLMAHKDLAVQAVAVMYEQVKPVPTPDINWAIKGWEAE